MYLVGGVSGEEELYLIFPCHMTCVFVGVVIVWMGCLCECIHVNVMNLNNMSVCYFNVITS